VRSTEAPAKCWLARDVSAFDDEPRIEALSWLQRSPRLLVCTIALLIAGTFVADLALPKHIALSALYAIPILFSLWRERRRFTISVAIVCLVLTPLGLLYGEPGPTEVVFANRSAALFTIVVITSIGLMRLRAERELRYVRKIALTTLRSLGDAVITISDRDRVRFVNRAAERLLGQPREALVGQRTGDVFITRDREPERPPVIELVERGIAGAREAVLFALGGHRIPIEYTRTLIETAEGERYGEVVVFRDIRARKEHEEAMRRLAYRDDVTGLPNRISLLDRFQLEIAHAQRNRERLGVLYLDLDGFKDVNDAHGHEAGDELLKLVAQRMRATLRAGDTVARLGGDEFVVLLPGVAGADEARKVGQKLVAAVEPEAQLGTARAAVSASVGISIYPRDGDEPETLMRRADKAMYRAKSLGRGRVELVRASDATG